jgi:hypothetical protein
MDSQKKIKRITHEHAYKNNFKNAFLPKIKSQLCNFTKVDIGY